MKQRKYLRKVTKTSRLPVPCLRPWALTWDSSYKVPVTYACASSSRVTRSSFRSIGTITLALAA